MLFTFFEMGECLAYGIRLVRLGYRYWNAVMEYSKDR